MVFTAVGSESAKQTTKKLRPALVRPKALKPLITTCRANKNKQVKQNFNLILIRIKMSTLKLLECPVYKREEFYAFDGVMAA